MKGKNAFEKAHPKYFSFDELTCTDLPLRNRPATFQQFLNILGLAHTLDILREDFGEPILINSAFRTEEVNEAVGGSLTSNHLRGLAADIRPADPSKLNALLCVIKKYESKFSEIIPYATFIHVSL